MKKILFNTFVALMSFLLTVNVVYAYFEKVEIGQSQITDTDIVLETADLMCDSQPVFGNGIYLQIARETSDGTDITIPDNYKREGFSNSPVYVYDESLNYIKSVEFDGVIPDFKYIDGCFYFQRTIYHDNLYDNETTYYKTIDGEKWEIISDDEYTFVIGKEKLTNGMIYYSENYTYEEDGIIYNTRKILEYLISDNKYQIEREDGDYVSGGVLKATDINYYILTKRDLENPNNIAVCTNYISLDALSMFEIPSDADISNAWNDDTYLYLGISQDEMSCYRIPITEMTDCIKVKYNDKYLSFAANPTIENDRTLVPMRFLFETMGADVEWHDETRTATVNRENEIISFSIDDTAAVVNSEVKTMDVPARLINGKTMIPIRFLSEELGFQVEWDEENRIVTIK